jgi:DNA-binding MarR family transcriptional regulator
MSDDPTPATTPPVGAPDRPIGYWLKLVDRLIDESFDGVFQHSGLTRRHWQVLNTIRDGVSEETSVDGVLSPFTGAAPVAGHGASAVTAEIDDLVRRGWVARDGAGSLSVTVAGNHAYHDLLDAVSVSRERVADGISRAEYAQTVATLERMARNLGWEG